jgi:replicative DNA helicase
MKALVPLLVLSTMTFNYSLDPVDNASAARDALEDIQRERTESRGLITRFPALNRGLIKQARFGTIYTFAGASGAAKSYLLNMIRTDFTDHEDMMIPVDTLDINVINHLASKGEFSLIEDNDGAPAYLHRKALNADLPFEVVFLHFTIEMSPKRENLRTLSTFTGWDNAYLKSSAAVSKEGINTLYNKLSDEEYEACRLVLNEFGTRKNILPFKLSPNIEQLKSTAYRAAAAYPGKKLIIAIDHGLLISKLDERSDRELLDNLIKAEIELRDTLDAMIINLAQLNSEIEDDNRRKNPKLHYPTKKDIYCGGQLYQGSDYVFTMFAPARIHLEEYGPDKLPTAGLIHLGLIKNRDGFEGNIWLRNRLDVGKLVGLERRKSAGTAAAELVEIPSLVNTSQ